MSEVFRIHRPSQQSAAVVFASPHSGRAYSAAFLQQTVLDSLTIRSSEDAFVDELFADAPLFGAPLLLAEVPRAYLDLNRAADEFDSAVIAGAQRSVHNPRVASGLGVIPPSWRAAARFIVASCRWPKQSSASPTFGCPIMVRWGN